jgi:hypothetical protein
MNIEWLRRLSVSYFVQESSYDDDQYESDKHQKKVSLDLHRRTAFIDRAATRVMGREHQPICTIGEKLDGHTVTLFDALSLKEAKQKGQSITIGP